jgi:hypothetical protein
MKIAVPSGIQEYNVPFTSQKTYSYSKRRLNGCGIASLKMLFDYWHKQDKANRSVKNIDTLYEEGLEAGAHAEGIGWMHAGLANIAKLYGYEAYNADFGPKSADPKDSDEAFKQLIKELKKGPVMASVFRGFDPEDWQGGGHLVVVTGINEHAIRLNDPEPVEGSDGRRVMPIASFKRAFKHRYIVVRPKTKK